ncbi:hypothetical protein [Clostridium ljungdahlii]|uniref:Uncharacterized protein n=1 Tax=Clostridium ljungdahlii (strain ATCC 55383 / DSM 13528 / PETC) TaxID=748727 RepID=D8GQ51_CLOLD|nr:hypothetical protein [Clostridium ljungdahlii]ADK16142.1 hypothetical protein CLJU_c30940 [Clostridium ljungdahlii DSM 13528]OAA84227.1 hypothetical protein WX45_01863 [Clostridium ljungdahlii DSM 13528]
MINLNNININKYNFNDKISKRNNSNSQDAEVYNFKPRSTGDKHILDEINNETDPIEKQEDLIFYSDLRKAGIDFKNSSSWELEKSRISGFPPTTAPGYVRQAFREALLNVPENERAHIALSLSFEYDMYSSKNKTGNPNSISFYNDFIKYTSQCNDFNRGLLGEDVYTYTKKLLNDFSLNLQKSTTSK